ncbi:MAG: Na+/H+ antiporter subunit E [bacterium]
MPARLLPSPVLSASLAAFWLLLNNTLHPAHVLLGLLLGWSLPLVARALCGRVDFPVRQRPGGAAWRLRAARAALSLAGVVVVDVVRSNIEVALLILGPKARLQSRFIEVPVALEDPVAVAVLAGICTMTPGTLSAGISPDRRLLTIHCLHAPDPEAVAAAIHTRYERPLAEIFPCSTSQS